MKTSIKLTAIATAISVSLGLVACGGGGGGSSTAGIGGSGITSSGTITGFGSVFVNGVKFETTNSTFDIEGVTGSQSDLAIGMVVQVNGTINSDGITGTADRITFDDDLQGPVSGYTLATDGLTATFTIMGINVKIDSKTTYFDPDHGGIAINTISNGDIAELSGFFDASGTLIASRIENKTGEESDVELKGNITGLNGARTNFTLKGINIDVPITVELDDLPNGLQNGIFVEVKGAYNDATSTITARKIESEELDFNDSDSDEFEIEGFITSFINISNFKVNGITVNASNALLSPRRMTLADNLQIEVEGRIINGVLQASELKMRGGEVEIEAPISNINFAANTFEVTPVTGQPSITIRVGVETEFENDITDSYSTRFTDLSIGQFVEVEGYLNDDDTVFAVEVEITHPDEIEIQGVVDNINIPSNQITVLGITFTTNGATEFEGQNDAFIPNLTSFKNAIREGQSWIKIEANTNAGIATEVEIEAY